MKKIVINLCGACPHFRARFTGYGYEHVCVLTYTRVDNLSSPPENCPLPDDDDQTKGDNNGRYKFNNEKNKKTAGTIKKP